MGRRLCSPLIRSSTTSASSSITTVSRSTVPSRRLTIPSPLDSKFEAFGWNVLVIDGHDIEAIDSAVKAAKACKGKPTAIICRTVKGKGRFLYGKLRKVARLRPNEEQYKQAVSEINSYIDSL